MKNLTQGKELSLILRLGFPIILGNLFQQLYTIVNSSVVGLFLGKNALAAVGTSYPIVFFLISLIIGIGSGGSFVIAQWYGAKNYQQVQNAVGTIYLTLFSFGIVICSIGYILAPQIFSLLDLAPEVTPSAINYFRIYLIGVCFAFGFNGAVSILRGMGDTTTQLYFLIGTNILNAILSLLFIGVFHLNLESSAWASVISQAIGCIGISYHLKRTRSMGRIQWKLLRFNRIIFGHILRVGLPTGVQQSCISLGQLFVVWNVNLFGINATASYAAAMRIDALSSIFVINLAQALSAFVGQNLGAQLVQRAKQGLYAMLKLSTGIALSTMFIFILFGRNLLRLFSADPEVIDIGYEYLVWIGATWILFALMFAFTGFFRGAGDTFIPMVITIFSLWILRIPAGYFFSLHFGTAGIWMGFPIGWSFGLLANVLYYKTKRWQKKIITKPPSSYNVE